MEKSHSIGSQSELDAYRRAQRIAYDCAEDVAGRLHSGISEREAAEMMRAYLTEHGINYYFHAPFVWFGERTELAITWGDDDFLPSEKRLEVGMPVILDVAPIVEGYAADIGYAFAFGANAQHEAMLADLEAYRVLIPKLLKEGRTMQEVYMAIDQRIKEQGYMSSHHAYPAGVIGHRVTTLQPEGSADEARAGGFGISAYRYLKDKKILSAKAPHLSPYWNDSHLSAHAPEVGLWAVEPHFARDGIGVKFEELLVVTESDVFWLDDELPHVQRWKRSAAQPTSQPPRRPPHLEIASS